jgi:hypothetical protein
MGDPMKRPSGAIAIIVLVLMLMTVYANMVVLLPPSNAADVGTFTDGTNEIMAEFPGTTWKEFEIPADANITGVSLNISTAEDGGDFPEDIQVLFMTLIKLMILFTSSYQKVQ